MLVYADYGVGKTFLAGTAADIPELRDVLCINAEGGDLTLTDPSHAFDKIDFIRCTNYALVARSYEFLKLHCQLRDQNDVDKLRQLESRFTGVPEEEIEEPKRYYTVIVDSLAEVESFNMSAILGVRDNVRLDSEVQAAEWAEYKKNHTMIQRLVRSFRDLPMHVIFTCPRQYTQDENKRFVFAPQLTGKLSNQVQGFMDVVGFLVLKSVEEEGKTERRLWVQPAGRFAAKCRFSTYKKAYFDNPTLPSIVAAVGLLGPVAKQRADAEQRRLEVAALQSKGKKPKEADAGSTDAAALTPEQLKAAEAEALAEAEKNLTEEPSGED